MANTSKIHPDDAGVMDYYRPLIWIDGPDMFATCGYLQDKSFVDTTMSRRMTFEHRLCRALRDEWGVLSENLTITYKLGFVVIHFNSPEEFVMTKIANG